MTPTLNRRGFLAALPGAAATVLLAGGPRSASADALSGSAIGETPPSLGRPALLVAGAADTAPGRWATLLAPRLASAFATGTPLLISATGGHDGVTGANTFDTQTTPDGSTALLVPGAAAMAWLAGDPRVHFDAGRWVPALASLSSGVLMARDTGGSPSAMPASGQSLRVAASTLAGPELPALLGLSMLGVVPEPVFGLSEPADAAEALRIGRVDAVFLSGHDVPARQQRLAAAGLQPLFSIETDDNPAAAPSGPAASNVAASGAAALGADGSGADPAMTDVPSLATRFRARNGADPSGPLFDAFRATAAAARLDVALVLPMLSPPSLVARWRSACEAALDDLGLIAAVRKAEVDAVPAPECVRVMAQINADESAQLALRRWLAERPSWQQHA